MAYRFKVSAGFKSSFNPSTDIEVTNDEKSATLGKHDMFLRKFQYSKALDAVLIPYIRKKKPSITVGVMHELIR